MSGFLLDTNVVSEMTFDAPNPRVIAFLAEQDDLWLPAVVVYELEYELQLVPPGRRRERLVAAHPRVIGAYGDRIIPLDRSGAEWAARFRAESRRAGRPLDLGDALIAGTARAHDLAVATRNVRDFEGLVAVVDPWEG